MPMQHTFDVVVVGANADGLALAASLSASGKKTALLEPDMKIGGELLTESFLSSHRYNLSGGWLLADSLAQLKVQAFNKISQRLLLPDIPLAFLFEKQKPLIFDRSLENLQSQILNADRHKLAQLFSAGESFHRAVHGHFGDNRTDVDAKKMLPLSAKSVKEVLDYYELTDPRLRCALTYLPLAMGWDIEKGGSGIAMAFLLYGMTRLSLIKGGSSMLANSLADTIIIKNGMIVESARIKKMSLEGDDMKSIELEDGRSFSAPVITFANSEMISERDREKTKHAGVDESQLGVYRIYLDFSHSPTGFSASGAESGALAKAYMVSFGFNSEQDVYRYLKMIKTGQPPFVAGHVISNNFLDVSDPQGALGLQDGPLWCTSCHTTDTSELRDRATALDSARQNGALSAPGTDRGAVFGIDAADKNNQSGYTIRPTPGSLIWQGILPVRPRTMDSEGFRKSFEQACIAKICQKVTGIEPRDVRFKLTWLANEVREPLLQTSIENIVMDPESDQEYRTRYKGVFVDPYARLARYSGIRSGQKLVSVLSNSSGLS